MSLILKPINGTEIWQGDIKFVMQVCGGCGIPFMVPKVWQDSKVEHKESFACPNKCDRVFIAETAAEKVRREMKIQLAQKEKELRESDERWSKDYQHIVDRFLDEKSTRKEREKTIKRMHQGVCPCCNRTFQNLKSHIETKHPEILTKRPKKANLIHTKINSKKK